MKEETNRLSTAQVISQGASGIGVALSERQCTQLADYLALLQKWNKVYNLTAVRDPAEMLTHHLLDCLAVIGPLLRHTQSQLIRLLDVGSGAGLPGVVVAICCPEISVTCVDTVSKKAAFIQQAAGALGLANLRGVHARVEEYKAEAFDVVTSRAFSSLVDLVSLTTFHVKQSTGVWMAMKGKHPSDELEALPAGVAMFHVEQLVVPGLDARRCLVWLRMVV